MEVDERVPGVLADPGLPEGVVANLVDNALRHSGSNPVRGVAVRVAAYSGDVELRVVDHGRGLPQGAADSAFAPFQRLGDRDAIPGVGLGLSVAKGFTEAMDGTIHAETRRAAG